MNFNIFFILPSTYQTINYVIDWRNYGSLDATGTTLTDVLPPQLEYLSSNPAADR